MAFQLYKTSKYSRVYKDDAVSPVKGFMKATIQPMHYESVLDSGVYDSSVDLSIDAITTDLIDGYTMTESSYQFEIQTVVPGSSLEQPNTQPEQGSIRYKGRRGANTLQIKPLRFCYYHRPTEAITAIQSDLSFAAAPTLESLTRNLGSHADVPDEIITSISKLTIATTTLGPASGLIEINAKPYTLRIENNIPPASRTWIEANDPPLTAVADTDIGVLLEIDWSDIPRVYANGVLVDPLTESFDDANGPIVLRDNNDNLIGTIRNIHTESAAWARRPQNRRYWHDAGTSYCMVYMGVQDWFDLPLTATAWTARFAFNVSQNLERFENESTQILSLGRPPFSNSYYSISAPENYSSDKKIGSTLYDFYGLTYCSAYNVQLRMFPDLPFKPGITDTDGYALLRTYFDSYPAYIPDVDPVYQPIRWRCDIASSNVGVIKEPAGFNSGPRTFYTSVPTEYSVKSYTYESGMVNCVTSVGPVGLVGEPLTPMDVSGCLEEALSLPGWKEGNALRLCQDPLMLEASSNRYLSFVSYQSALIVNSSCLDVVFYYGSGVRKPGVNDYSQLRNRRSPRTGGDKGNDASFRLGRFNSPQNNTFDNKNRNRFS